jgi:hypothetical protein
LNLLEEIPKLFVERFLNTHSQYLKSLADISAHLYFKEFDDWEVACNNMLLRLIPNGSLPHRDDIEGETAHFRNLRNCWYHECALNYPFDDTDKRMLFAAWKIIQFYYTVFSSIATLVCIDEPQRKRHNEMIKKYMTAFVCNSRNRGFCLPPTNFYLNQDGTFSPKFSEMVNWKYADEYHFPLIEACLNLAKKQIAIEASSSEKWRIGIPHYLKTLRDWANYQDAYLFFRLYGDKVKFHLDFSLKRIAFVYCGQTEYFLLKTFGWEPVNLQFTAFRKQLKDNLGINSPTLEGRFNSYSSNRKLFS